MTQRIYNFLPISSKYQMVSELKKTGLYQGRKAWPKMYQMKKEKK